MSTAQALSCLPRPGTTIAAVGALEKLPGSLLDRLLTLADLLRGGQVEVAHEIGRVCVLRVTEVA